MRLTGMPTALIYTKPGMFIIKPLLGTRYVVPPTLLDGIRTDRISPLSHGQPQGWKYFTVQEKLDYLNQYKVPQSNCP